MTERFVKIEGLNGAALVVRSPDSEGSVCVGVSHEGTTHTVVLRREDVATVVRTMWHAFDAGREAEGERQHAEMMRRLFPAKSDRPYFCRHSERPEACNVCNLGGEGP